MPRAASTAGGGDVLFATVLLSLLGRSLYPLSLVVFLCSKVYVMWLSTCVPINSKPTKASSRGRCVLSKTDEHMGPRGSKESSHTYVCKMIDNVCMGRLYPASLSLLFTGLAHAGTLALGPILGPYPFTCEHAFQMQSTLMHVHSLKPHSNPLIQAEVGYCHPLINREAQTSSVIFPRLLSKQMSTRKPRPQSHQVQNLTVQRDAGGWCGPRRKELLVCPTFRDERANAVISHCAELILIS